MEPEQTGQTLATFEARVQQSKNRLVAIPAAVQRELGLSRRPRNHLVHVSLRRGGSGRWNHHYFKLTTDNEFSIPADIARIRPGDLLEIKIHAVIPDEALFGAGAAAGASVLLRLAERPRQGYRTDGSLRVDELLNDRVAADSGSPRANACLAEQCDAEQGDPEQGDPEQGDAEQGDAEQGDAENRPG